MRLTDALAPFLNAIANTYHWMWRQENCPEGSKPASVDMQYGRKQNVTASNNVEGENQLLVVL